MWCYIAACAAVTCSAQGETLYRDTLCSMPAQVGNITGDPCVTMSPCLTAGNPSLMTFYVDSSLTPSADFAVCLHDKKIRALFTFCSRGPLQFISMLQSRRRKTASQSTRCVRLCKSLFPEASHQTPRAAPHVSTHLQDMCCIQEKVLAHCVRASLFRRLKL